MDIHRAARIAHIGHGLQVLLSETTSPLVRGDLPDGVTLRDLGRHRLKDIRRPEHIHQLGIEGLPQSATGQTALFTGINAAQLLGRHLFGFPNQPFRR